MSNKTSNIIRPTDAYTKNYVICCISNSSSKATKI